MLSVNVINNSGHELPTYETKDSAGLDLRANLPDGSITLGPLERKLIPTGLHIALPAGCEGQVRARSGLALKHGIGLVNSPGTLDADFRGELQVLLINFSNEPFEIKDGERIAQLVVARYETIEWNPTDELNDTERGKGGFGSTGK